MGLNPIGLVSLLEENVETKGRQPCGDRGQAWSDAARSQGLPGSASRRQTLERGMKWPLPHSLQREPPCKRHLDLRHPGSLTVRRSVSVVGATQPAVLLRWSGLTSAGVHHIHPAATGGTRRGRLQHTKVNMLQDAWLSAAEPAER